MEHEELQQTLRPNSWGCIKRQGLVLWLLIRKSLFDYFLWDSCPLRAQNELHATSLLTSKVICVRECEVSWCVVAICRGTPHLTHQEEMYRAWPFFGLWTVRTGASTLSYPCIVHFICPTFWNPWRHICSMSIILELCSCSQPTVSHLPKWAQCSLNRDDTAFLSPRNVFVWSVTQHLCFGVLNLIIWDSWALYALSLKRNV
jgi:hypothetical protein